MESHCGVCPTVNILGIGALRPEHGEFRLFGRHFPRHLPAKYALFQALKAGNSECDSAGTELNYPANSVYLVIGDTGTATATRSGRDDDNSGPWSADIAINRRRRRNHAWARSPTADGVFGISSPETHPESQPYRITI
jgi:hypothetical protein